MKRIMGLSLIAIVLLFAGCASFESMSAARNGEVIVKYDDMTDTKISEVFIIKDKFSLLLAPITEQFVWRVAESKTSTNYYICFRLTGHNWWFVNSLLIKAGNNEPILLKEILQDRNVRGSGLVSEWVVFKTSLEMFRTVANAQNVRMRIIGSKHREDYDITSEDQIIIQRLVATM